MAVAAHYGASVAWHCEFDKHPSKILAKHFPDVPNYGDVSAVDWSQVEPVDILTGGFPCFPAGTLITTDTGQVPIEDVRVGDSVLTHRRRMRPVVQTMTRVADHRVHVKVMGAPVVVTTDEHPFYARRTRDSDPEWIAAGDLTRNMFVAQPVDCPEGISTDSELARWYLIGRWLGDGWTVVHPRVSSVPKGHRGSRVHSMATRVHWCCAASESADLEKRFADAGLSVTRSDERTVVKYVMQSREWARALVDFGHRAHGKQLPDYVHALPMACQASLLQGWLDSDGDVKGDGTLNGVTVSRKLAVGMARVARSVYGKAVSVHEVKTPNTTVIEGRVVSQRDYYCVRIATGINRQAFMADGWVWSTSDGRTDAGAASRSMDAHRVK